MERCRVAHDATQRHSCIILSSIAIGSSSLSSLCVTLSKAIKNVTGTKAVLSGSQRADNGRCGRADADTGRGGRFAADAGL